MSILLKGIKYQDKYTRKKLINWITNLEEARYMHANRSKKQGHATIKMG